MVSVLLLFAVLALTIYGQLIMKWGALIHTSDSAGFAGKEHYLVAMFSDIWVLSALAAGIGVVTFWMLAIARLDVGYAYPFMALSFVLVPVGSAIFFGETLPKIQLLALMLIVAGVTISALTR
jgi:drug/metabolite transporter (DMT)-like permease